MEEYMGIRNNMKNIKEYGRIGTIQRNVKEYGRIWKSMRKRFEVILGII
jgi:hypothetical protein